MSAIYTSQDAYNGCLSLFSFEERQQRGDTSIYLCGYNSQNKLFAKINLSEKVIGKNFGAHLYELKKYFLESQRRSQLPTLNHESVNEIIATSDEAYEFYSSTIMDNTKIQIIEDPRSFDTLRKCFTHLPLDFVSHVWMGQETWGACFDILSTLRPDDHNSFTFTFTFDPISDPASWPTLQHAYPRLYVNMSRSISPSVHSFALLRESEVDSQRDHHDIISLSNSSLSGFSWHICTNEEKEIDDFDEIQSIENLSEVSWEVLPNDQIDRVRLLSEESEMITRAQSPHSLPVSMPQQTVSYKEALLTIAPNPTPLRVEPPKNLIQLTRVFRVETPSIQELEPFDDYWEDDTYNDWLEASCGSKETSIAALNRARIYCSKISHQKKKKSSINYHRKHAR